MRLQAVFINLFSVCFAYDAVFYEPRLMGEPLFPYIRAHHTFDRGNVRFEEYNDWKTGKKVEHALYSDRYRTSYSARWEVNADGFYWVQNVRAEDSFPEEHAVACSYGVHERFEFFKEEKRIDIGEIKSFEHGKVRVKCGRFDGHVRKVSEAVTGCYLNGTVYKLGEEWTEPNSDGLEETSTINKTMFCSKSAAGYFESKLIGCSQTHIQNFTYGPIVRVFETTDRIQLNSTNEVSPYIMCTEDTPGRVKLINVNERKEAGCLIDNVWHKGSEPWIDEQRGAVFECHSYSQYRKTGCLMENRRISIDKELKLSNGCTLLCHPQTNIYKCDTPLIDFEVAGKVRKSNH